ncbi:ATP-binding cassette sub-family A member 12 [Rhinatrema bivittatum]|uniref:ATP-binding cassette sub-family A member 12 n=1 Tax=Rhinatrema bivittatum TaxID=194408 RepID=UPI0011289177|nr:ATP-binding cassette sub-family A member 12 [Rhinatrema bivittatum]
MSSFLQQLRVLLWKNWLSILRQPVWSLVLILWPLAIFLILAITRTKFPPSTISNCYLAPRNLQSTGLYPFLQTFFCVTDAKCNNVSYIPNVKLSSSRISSNSSNYRMGDSPYTNSYTTKMNTSTTLVEDGNLLQRDAQISENSTLPGDANSTSNAPIWQAFKALNVRAAPNKPDYTHEESHYWPEMKPYFETVYGLITSLSSDKINRNNCEFNISVPNVDCNSSINWSHFYQSLGMLTKNLTDEPMAKSRLLKLDEFQNSASNLSTESPYSSLSSCLRNFTEIISNQSLEHLQEMDYLIQSVFVQNNAFNDSSFVPEFLSLKILELRKLINHLCKLENIGSSHQVCHLTCQYILLVLDVAELGINSTIGINAAADNLTARDSREASSFPPKGSTKSNGTDLLKTLQQLFLGDIVKNGINMNWAMDKLYPLPEDCLDMLKIPKVDSSVSADTKHTTIPVVGATALKDVQDRKLEFFLKQIFEVLALGVRVMICSSLKQRASLSVSNSYSAEAEQAKHLEGAIAYGMDAFYDLLRIQAKAVVSAVSARHLLWLRNWSTDSSSKAELGTLPFKGKLLFVEDLEQLIKSLEFARDPPDLQLISPCSRQKRPAVCQTFNSLQLLGAIVPVPVEEQGTGQYSIYFVVPKKGNYFRPILDLKRVNRALWVPHFRMETLRAVIAAVRPGKYLASLDLTEAYFHIPIRKEHQRYLCFHILDQHFQFQALSFGLATAPHTFTKVMVVVAAALCRERILVLEFLGARFDTRVGKVFLPDARVLKLIDQVNNLLSLLLPTVWDYLQVLGTMASTIDKVPWAFPHIRPLQKMLLSHWKPVSEQFQVTLPLSNSTIADIQWWLLPAHLLKGMPLLMPQVVIVMTDASLSGWGAVCQSQTTQGYWSPAQSRWHINCLEALAVCLALKAFLLLIRRKAVRVLCDNSTMVAYINCQGGTRSHLVALETSKLFTWVEWHLDRLAASHIAVKQLFLNPKQVELELFNLGISSESIQAMMNVNIPDDKFQITFWFNTLHECRYNNSIVPKQFREFCNTTSMQGFQMAIIFLRHVDVFTFIYRIFIPNKWQQTFNMTFALFKQLFDILNQKIYELLDNEALANLINLLKSILQSTDSKVAWESRGIENIQTILMNLYNASCSKTLLLLLLYSTQSNLFENSDPSNMTEEGMINYGIPLNASRYCQRYFWGLVGMPNGAILWGSLKPLLLGKIIYTPHTPETEEIMTKSVSILEEMKKMRNDLQTISEMIQYDFLLLKQIAPIVKELQVILRNPYAQAIIILVLNTNITMLTNNLKKVDNFISQMVNYENQFSQMSPLINGLENVLSCISYDRLYTFNSTKELEINATNLLKTNDLLASVIFQLPSTSRRHRRAASAKPNLPQNVKYTIRMKYTFSEPTSAIRDTYWVPGPHNSISTYQSYGRVFIFLQESIDRAIIEMQTQKNLQDIAVQCEAMPYPCYNKDIFLYGVSFALPIVLMVAWILFVAVFVKKLVYEKELKLHEYMKIMGVNSYSHFLAWFIESSLFLLITVIILVIILKAGSILPHSNGFILFLYLLDYSFAVLAMSYLISVFFSNANIAALSGSLIYIITFFPYIVMISQEKYLSFAEKTLLGLFAPTSFSYASQYISRYESQNIGIQWNNMYTSPVVMDETSFGWFCWLLVIDSFIYFIIGWYIRMVFPGKYGIGIQWYFPFLPSFWAEFFGCSSLTLEKKSGLILTNILAQNEDASFHKQGDLSSNFEPEPRALIAGISLHGLTKRYQTKSVVHNLNLNFYEGQLTTLLGHNGAGKTTTISMLTGLFSASSGTILVYGKDIRTHLNQIRRSMGVCMQYDVLFDHLTTKEHLLLYAAIKAPQWTRQELHDEVSRILKDTGLYNHRHKQVGNLSGGMKRKLSISIAFIGGSKVVILDEPTTGVDPCSRRSIWDIISKHKAGKTIILSTHHLDEAEVLSDRIAFLEQGGLKCCGSPLYLKEKFGDGYHLTLTKKYRNLESTNLCDTEAVTALIQSHIPEASLKEDIGGELVYLLPSYNAGVSRSYLSLLRSLDADMNDLQIGCYGISDTTIEEVFLKLTEGLDREEDDTDWSRRAIPIPNNDFMVSDENSVTSYDFPDRDDLALTRTKKLGGLTLMLKKFKAIFIKRFHNSRRNWKGYIAQIVLPVLFVIASMGIGSFKQGAQNYPALRLSPSLYGSSDQSVVFENYSNLTNDLVSAMLSFPGIDNMCLDNSLSCLSKNYLDKWRFSGNQTADYGACNCSTKSQPCPRFNFSPPHRRTFSSQMLYNISGYNMENYLLTTALEFVQQRYGGWSFGLPLSRDLKIDIKPVPSNRTLSKVWYNPEGYHSLPAFLNSLNNFILRANLHENDSSQYGISTWSQPYPGSVNMEQTMISNMVNMLVAISILVGYSITTASFVNYVVKEHHTGAKRLQHISGVSTTFYWMTNFTYDMIIYMVPVILSIGIIAAFRIPAFFDNQNLAAVSLLFVLFGFSTFSWMYLLSGTFKNSGMAFIVYVSINLFIGITTIISTTVVYILFQQKSDKNLQNTITTLKNVFKIFPQFCFGYGLIELSQQQTIMDSYKLYGINYKIMTLEMDIVGWNLVAMAIEGTLCLVLRLLINEVLFQTIRRFVRAKWQKFHHVVNTVDEDEDVQAERIRVESGRADMDQLQLCGLTKIYHQIHRQNIAVNNMSLGVPAGECFGLLGVNGAGKTTTFKMLTGDIAPSKGNIRIRNQTGALLDVFDCRIDSSVIGYCPQEDALDELLTGSEHLYYYARLHGIPEARIKKVVLHLLHKLQLLPYKDRITAKYSCGTRRKLSTALALVGGPSILLLDEPSSGMDPKTKRYLWKVISEEVRDKCAVVLTSHSMEECEALCTRLAIMVNGKFQCIGSLQHIKHRFGGGFTVKVHMKDGEVHAETLTQFMHMHFPNTYLKDQHFSMLEYHIPISAGGVANIFDLLETNKSDLNIKHFSVSQTTLDEVFINFAKSQLGQDDDSATIPDTNETIIN